MEGARFGFFADNGLAILVKSTDATTARDERFPVGVTVASWLDSATVAVTGADDCDVDARILLGKKLGVLFDKPIWEFLDNCLFLPTISLGLIAEKLMSRSLLAKVPADDNLLVTPSA